MLRSVEQQASSLTFLIASIFTLFISSFLGLVAPAEAINLQGVPATVAEAEEFFTDDWADPLDFNDICDFGFDGFFYSPKSVSNGIWTGTNVQVQGPLPLGPVHIPTTGTMVPTREGCSRIGLNRPINANKYTMISWRQRVSQSSIVSVLWSLNRNFATQGFDSPDGVVLPGGVDQTPPNTWTLKMFSLPQQAPAGNPWSGNVTGLSVWPAQQLPIGGSTSLDYVRIIDPDTSPQYALAWNGASTSGPTVSVTLYVDNDNSGFDGMAAVRNLPSGGTTNFITGVLPPGNHFFYAQLETHNNTSVSVIERSGYVGPLTINGKPRLQFTAPSRMSGTEYSRDQISNPWDMNDAADVVNITNPDGTPTDPLVRGFDNPNFANGIFTATSTDATGGNIVDTQVHFNVPAGRPVDTTFYRYFCHRLYVDPANTPRNGDAALLNLSGLVARFLWVRSGPQGGFGSTGAHELLERVTTYPDFANGFTTYCIDLWDPENIESGTPWKDLGLATTARFDPVEATPATNFAIDEAGLYADNRTTAAKTYQITWNSEDPENNLLTINLFYDTDNAGFNGTQIVSLPNQTPGQGSHTWNAAGVPDGTYFIYAVVSDGTNTSRFYSDVSVIVSAAGDSPPPSPSAVPCDFDGDRKSDYAVVRRDPATGNATTFVLKSSDGTNQAIPLGNVDQDVFDSGDFDGDVTSDLIASRARQSPSIVWFYLPSSSGFLQAQGWGIAGDMPVSSDIDGDNKTDFTIFRQSDGTWWSIRSLLGPAMLNWGLPGDLPVSADYDGDQWDDIAIWRPGNGFWAVLQSSRGASTALADILFVQWGLSGDHPMPGDYDGDRKVDLVVYRPAFGFWFICSSQTNYNCALGSIFQFGLPGDFPISGDFDGDGIFDLALWRPSGGFWFVRRSSDGQVAIQQWGLPNDIPVCMGAKDRAARLP